jgi:hypothetical protein
LLKFSDYFPSILVPFAVSRLLKQISAFLEIINCPSFVFLFKAGKTPIVVGTPIVRIEANSFVEIADRTL